MASRKAAVDNAGDDNGRPSKRPRFDQDTVDDGTAGPSLDDLNGDCLLQILSYLPADDLNSIAICSRRYRVARAHESLDQTRTGTIIISEGYTFRSLCDSITGNNWNEVFQGNRTHLTVIGLENLMIHAQVRSENYWRAMVTASRLSGVTSLHLSGHLNDDRSNGDFLPLHHGAIYIFELCPNLQEAALTSLEMNLSSSAWGLCQALSVHCPNLNCVTWHGCQVRQHVSGFSLGAASNLTELSLDGCRFLSSRMQHMTGLPERVNDEDNYMFRYCQSLTRLSIKNATYKNLQDWHFQPIPQEMIIDMVRRHPTLRWLCSDLSEKYVAMLRLERPDIVFVSE